MKYTDCKIGEIYKCWFRASDYWVIEFDGIVKDGYFFGKGVYIGSKGMSTDKTTGLKDIETQWVFEVPSSDDLEAFYKKYNKIYSYEIY